MPEMKIGKSKNGTAMHYSVGALIEREGKYLLIDRVNPPFGFAGVGGHIDKNEDDPTVALLREVKEESGLNVEKFNLLEEQEVENNTCVTGVSVHYWRLYKCETSGEIKQDQEEEKSIGWYTVDEIKNLKLEPIWQYWFEKLKII